MNCSLDPSLPSSLPLVACSWSGRKPWHNPWCAPNQLVKPENCVIQSPFVVDSNFEWVITCQGMSYEPPRLKEAPKLYFSMGKGYLAALHTISWVDKVCKTSHKFRVCFENISSPEYTVDHTVTPSILGSAQGRSLKITFHHALKLRPCIS